MKKDYSIGSEMYKWSKDIFPYNRSITGPGVRKTLKYFQNIIPQISIKSIPSGTKVFDWVIPDEWNLKEAYIRDENGSKIIDFKNNNLHVVGYSHSIDEWLTFEDLDSHLFSLPEQPNAIPYVTSYYERNWGFCLTHNQRKKLKNGKYHVVINSELNKGCLNYGELIIPGEEEKEIFLSSYICHPSMANNEISGPVVTIALAKWVLSKPRKYTFRIVLLPETIGSITYLSKNIDQMKKNISAGFNITCIGDDRCYSYLPSRKENTLSDMAALHVLKNIDPEFKRYGWLDRGSDERQYCAPGIDLPIASIMRSKYGEYPEYHTSLDNLNFITETGLEGGYNALLRSIQIIEKNGYYKSTILGEPQLGKRNLYPTLGIKKVPPKNIENFINILTYCDGEKSLLEISNLLNISFWNLLPIIYHLVELDLIEKIK